MKPWRSGRAGRPVQKPSRACSVPMRGVRRCARKWRRRCMTTHRPMHCRSTPPPPMLQRRIWAKSWSPASRCSAAAATRRHCWTRCRSNWSRRASVKRLNVRCSARRIRWPRAGRWPGNGCGRSPGCRHNRRTPAMWKKRQRCCWCSDSCARVPAMHRCRRRSMACWASMPASTTAA
ncbi:hypothetical protein D3C72_1144260 [compost metagenome]